jgi:hypothetical protein
MKKVENCEEVHEGRKVGSLHRPGISEAEALGAIRVNALVKKTLNEDGLRIVDSSRGFNRTRTGGEGAVGPVELLSPQPAKGRAEF